MTTPLRKLFLLRQLCRFLAASPYVWVLVFAALLYGPFLGMPVLRTGGDEKVYIAQALEMAERGSWFVQTLAGTPNYYKGPLHYILLRVGFLVFGPHSLWSVLWPNFLAVTVASLCVVRISWHRLGSATLAAALGMGLLAAGGIYAHVFTSQMEIELVGMYAVTLLLVDTWRDAQRPRLTSFLLWTAIGLAGWLKSPLHSVLLGTGVLVLSCREPLIRRTLWSPSGITAVLCGVLVGCAGYAIPWILDPKSFYQTYILRETMAKQGNEVRVWETFLPNLTINLWPFMPFALVGLLAWAWAAFSPSYRQAAGSSRRRPTNALTHVALAMSLPTFLFFGAHPYRSAIYTLPCIPAIFILCGVGLHDAQVVWPTVVYSAGIATVVLASFVPGLVLVLGWKFGSTAAFWPGWLTLISAITFAGSALGLVLLMRYKTRRPDVYMLATLPSLLIGGLLMSIVGQGEISGLRVIADDFLKSGRSGSLGYYNLQRHTWSEWGVLNVLLGSPVVGLHDEATLTSWLESGQPIIVPSQAYLDQLKARAKNPHRLTIREWSRWQSHDKDSVKRGPMAAWRAGDLSLLQSKGYVVSYE